MRSASDEPRNPVREGRAATGGRLPGEAAGGRRPPQRRGPSGGRGPRRKRAADDRASGLGLSSAASSRRSCGGRAASASERRRDPGREGRAATGLGFPGWGGYGGAGGMPTLGYRSAAGDLRQRQASAVSDADVAASPLVPSPFTVRWIGLKHGPKLGPPVQEKSHGLKEDVRGVIDLRIGLVAHQRSPAGVRVVVGVLSIHEARADIVIVGTTTHEDLLLKQRPVLDHLDNYRSRGLRGSSCCPGNPRQRPGPRC